MYCHTFYTNNATQYNKCNHVYIREMQGGTVMHRGDILFILFVFPSRSWVSSNTNTIDQTVVFPICIVLLNIKRKIGIVFGAK